MRISGTTRLVGIFGDPVTHSLSPVIHNAAFKALGIDMAYVPFHVFDKDLKKAVGGIRALNLVGVSVTVPHKERIIKHLDRTDDMVRIIGSVNTVVNTDGELKGYNTDAFGYLRSLKEEHGFDPLRKRVILVGAGGSSRAILYEFLALGVASITLVNRTRSRAEALASEYGGLFPAAEMKVYTMDEFASCEGAACAKVIGEADLIVNTTSVGLMNVGCLDLPLERLSRDAIVSDIVYRPLETAFLRKARGLGLRAHSGLGMLVHQGAVAFELWTRKEAPVDVMRQAALEALKTIE
ncbi:MAG: shikimate dehydrogenase [Deltaproteobacteria bacterium RIFCSPLOWO2_02_FULL_53_8]|nr:MAG: shikimate dehydrogenase [Deltaproteobacteria bacterium RIFCSPLOWO2_02_FULL_53_8]